ncbi:ABC transporter permease [Liquorilactobacillus satsumensis]|uniref:ABC transporter permease n=1 Tax=Liquorilactobacillus satsumensis TaxID=259059 RepID=UPI000704CD05|nr:ABC transporter permease subunit [Liquorilactobacillus satsumensis]
MSRKKLILNFLVLFIFAFFMYGPLLNTLMLAFANKYQAPHVLPLSFGFTWWQNVFAQSDLLQAFFNSFLVATLSTFFSMLICLPAAYAIARYHFKGRSLFLFSFLLSNAFPKIGLYTAIGIIFYKMQLMGTLTGVVLINILNTMIFMIWIPTGAFQNVYRQQEEAARDVGAGPLRTFFTITFPSALPAIVVAAMYTFLGALDESQGTLLIGFPQVKTMATAMYGIILDQAPMVGAIFALLLVLPAILILWLCYKFFGKKSFLQQLFIK